MAAVAGLIRGLDRFQAHFADYADQYVLLGGSAATLTMDAAGLAFRATKDLDIVLHVEALTPRFVDAFWAFVNAAGYEVGQRSDGVPQFYRFLKPADRAYPAMLEAQRERRDGCDVSSRSKCRRDGRRNEAASFYMRRACRKQQRFSAALRPSPCRDFFASYVNGRLDAPSHQR